MSAEPEEDKSKEPEDELSARIPLPDELFPSTPLEIFDDEAYYPDLVGYLDDKAKEFNLLINKYFKTQDQTEKQGLERRLLGFRQILWQSIWKDPNFPLDSKESLSTRYSVVHPKLLGKEGLEKLRGVFLEPQTDTPIYYLDEWLRLIKKGAVRSLNSDDDGGDGGGSSAVEQLEGALERKENLEEKVAKLKDKALEVLKNKHSLLGDVLEGVRSISDEDFDGGGPDEIVEAFNESDLGVVKGCIHKLQEVLKVNQTHEAANEKAREEESEFNELLVQIEELEIDAEEERKEAEDFPEAMSDDIDDDIDDEVEEQEEKKAQGGGGSGGGNAVVKEVENAIQLIKMTEGPTGNRFPFLVGTLMPGTKDQNCFREVLAKEIYDLEEIQPKIFVRNYRRKESRVLPYFIIVPSYGPRGVCWEPLDPKDKATGRGVIAMPLWAQNVQAALLVAMADYCWQVAKEFLGPYWLQEGLTGEYCRILMKEKVKGDQRRHFIPNYILWVTKESKGVQKLTKDVRDVFWRYLPFSEEVKDDLAAQSPLYSDLRRLDKNREKRDKNK